MVIDLPPYVEQVLVQQAQAQGMSVADLVMQKFGLTQNATQCRGQLVAPNTFS